MKAIILAAWKGSRLRPLTNTTPKPLIKIVWKSIIEHNIENIYNSVDEIIIVVKYLKDNFKKELWDNYKWTKITYFVQWEDKWTWWAIRGINFKWDFLLINWDSIFEKKDINNLINYKWYGCLTREIEDPSKYWVFEKNKDNNAIRIIEKPKKFYWNTTNVWVYKFNDKIFKINNEIKLSERWEYEITDSINWFCKIEKFKLINMEWNFIDIWYPWDILNANKYFLENLKESKIKGTIEENVTIKWNIILEKWAILKNWTYIEWNCYIWKNTSIGPNIYLRWITVIWNNCHIWANNEIKNSNIWDNTNIAHLSYIWDSVIWNNINIGWGFITANLRHDKANIKVPIKWVLTDTWLRKFWVVIWDNTKTWINASSMPGRLVNNWSLIMPSEIII